MSRTRIVVAALLALCLSACAGASSDDAENGDDATELGDEDSLRVRSDTIELASGTVKADDAEDLREAAGERALVKLAAPPTAAQLEELEAQVERVYAYLPDDAFLVKLRAGGDLDAAGARWTARYRAEHKIGPSVRAAAESTDERVIVMVQLFPDADLDRGVDSLRAAGVPEAAIVGRKATRFFHRVRLLLSPAELERLAPVIAADPDVFWLDVEGRRVLLNDTSVWVGQSGLDGGQQTPVFARGIFGEGQVVAVLDSGIDADMCYFRDPARGLPPMNVCDFGTEVDPAQRKVIAVDFLWDQECAGGISTDEEWDGHGHGTHVAGTIAGDNFASPLAHDTGDGMAPGAKLVIQDCGGPEEDDCADCSGIGCPVVDLNPYFQQSYDQGARIHNNSWGDRENFWPQNNYTAACQDVDEFTWEHPDFLIVFAAGNSGPGQGSVGSPSTAKSALSVGATRRGTGAEQMASFSSCGPTDDGRIKPELTMPGQGIISADFDGDVTSNNCTRAAMSGTSMASPGAAGLAALVRQYFADGFYPSGAARSGDGFNPSAALVRATMVSSARAMTGATVIPSNCQGWGRVTLDDALYFGGDSRRMVVRDDTTGFARGAGGETRTFKVAVRAGQPLKVTLAWSDYPSTPAASKHLVNDLDLEVSGPGGTWLGNVFASGGSTTGGAADRKNTMEQVRLASPAAGDYTVTVRAFTVPQGPQPFALVVTGDVSSDNAPPEASAGGDVAAATSALVTLDGRGSRDTDGPAALGYIWTQTAGPQVRLTGDRQPVARFNPLLAGSYTFELTVEDGAASDTDSVTVTVTGQPASIVYDDDFDAERGWIVNPAGTDNATKGQWQRGNPSNTSRQLGRTVSGFFDLVTGRLAGSSAGSYDLDGGKTSAQSPSITLPSGELTIAFSYYLAHAETATSRDYLRVKVGSQTVFEVKGAETSVKPAWDRATVRLPASLAGQQVRVVVEAADDGRASLLEAAVDDIVILRR